MSLVLKLIRVFGRKVLAKIVKIPTRIVDDDGIWTAVQQLGFGHLAGKTSNLDDHRIRFKQIS